MEQARDGGARAGNPHELWTRRRAPLSVEAATTRDRGRRRCRLDGRIKWRLASLLDRLDPGDSTPIGMSAIGQANSSWSVPPAVVKLSSA